MFKTLSGLKDNAFWRAPHQITPHQLDVSSHSIRAGHGGNSRFGTGRFVRFSAIYPVPTGGLTFACWQTRVNFNIFSNKSQEKTAKKTRFFGCLGDLRRYF